MLQPKVKDHVWWLGTGCNYCCADELHGQLLPRGEILLFSSFPSRCSLAPTQKVLPILLILLVQGVHLAAKELLK